MKTIGRILVAAALAVSSAALGACATDGYHGRHHGFYDRYDRYDRYDHDRGRHHWKDRDRHHHGRRHRHHDHDRRDRDWR